MCKMPEKIDEDVFSNDDIDLDGIECDIVTFFSHNMGHSTIDLNISSLTMITLMMFPPVLFLLDLLIGVIDLNTAKHVKKIA